MPRLHYKNSTTFATHQELNHKHKRSKPRRLATAPSKHIKTQSIKSYAALKSAIITALFFVLRKKFDFE
jgi:hypothetical protein